MDWGKIIVLKDSDDEIPIDEHFKLIAGPGAGKTRFLINHITHILKESKKLNISCKILCITHTNIAVDTIKERLRNTINEVEVSTIHSFLYENVVGPYLWTLNDDFDQDLLNMSYVGEIIPSFSLIPGNKKYYMSHEDYHKFKKIFWNFENQKMILQSKYNFSETEMEQFKHNCWEKGKLSHDDVLYFAYKILKKYSKIAEVLRAKFPYVFIDEFQDISNLQFEILKLIFQQKVIIGFIGDYAQSIYSFQGANMELFLKSHSNMTVYTIKNNFRSTEEIVYVLNKVRNDRLIKQKSMSEERSNDVPKILVGPSLEAYKYANSQVNHINVLSYTHDYLNQLKFEILGVNYVINDKFVDFINFSDDDRNFRVINVIKAMEYFFEFDIKKALNSLHFAYRSTIYEDNEEYLLKKLFELSNSYNNFYKLNCTEFYNNYIYEKDIDKFSKITGGNVKNIFDSIGYGDILVNIKDNDFGDFRTIHSCKGSQFKNVLLLLEDQSDLNFILSPNILNVEKHRRNYVAISRAKNNLFLNVPSLDESKIEKLEDKGFKVHYLKNK